MTEIKKRRNSLQLFSAIFLKKNTGKKEKKTKQKSPNAQLCYGRSYMHHR